ncbi:MAG: M48 family metalloprotease [Cyanobacteria bacterium J06598_3]
MKRFALFLLAATSGLIVAIATHYSLGVQAQVLPAAASPAQMADTVEDSFEAILGNDVESADEIEGTETDVADEENSETTAAEAVTDETVTDIDSDEADLNPNAAETLDDTATAEDNSTAPDNQTAEEGNSSQTVEEDSADKKPTAAPEGEAADTTPRLTESERIRRKLLIQADSEYNAGNVAAAEALYRQAKNETWLLPHQFEARIPDPFTDPTQLSPAGGVYWREAQAGIASERTSQALVGLALLSEEYPAFIPGHLQYAETLRANDRAEEANAVLEQALAYYPDQTDLLLAQVDGFMAQEQWIEAAIASRQFVALNPEHPASEAQATLAAENLGRFQSTTRASIRNGAIANAFTGILGYAFTGSIFGPFTAANSAIMLLQGENAVGNQFANQIEQQLPMVQHPEANAYIRQLGNRLSRVTGRNDLDYEFFVILDPNLNAFALPGGKIFVNAGAILKTDSEAELAGLLAHELSHSVLSHGFQIATQGNLSSSVAQYLPYGGLINNVFLSGYSRNMERQADIVGTQILSAGGYAADGLHNVMVTLNEEAEGPRPPQWISSHPNPEDRVTYLKNLIERGGYNRYAYEGIATHEEIQTIVARELAAYEAQQEEENEAAEETPTTEEQQTDLYDAVERFNW